jgi:AraC-like DNA-binding protein
MKRAAELSAIDERGPDSRFAEKAWTSRSEPEPAFMSVAVSRWHIVVTTRRDVTQLTVRGPETTATVTPVPAGAGFFGIVFRLGTSMPLAGLAGRAVTLPAATPGSVWFEGSRWEIPAPANAGVFVNRLVRKGLILRDPVVAESLQGDAGGQSKRTFQRRAARAICVIMLRVRPVARAGKAVEALGKGLSPQDAALLPGYAGQAHLTRALRRFTGQTPAQVNRGSHWPVDTPVGPRSPGDP